MPSIAFNNESITLKLKNKKEIKSWLLSVAEEEDYKFNFLNYIFTSDSSLLKLNQDYLSHNTLTDIITFDLSDDLHTGGDIFISIDRVKENSIKFVSSFEEELLRVMVHGLLHLIGYKDKTGPQKKIMRSKENFYLNQIKVPRGTST